MPYTTPETQQYRGATPPKCDHTEQPCRRSRMKFLVPGVSSVNSVESGQTHARPDVAAGRKRHSTRMVCISICPILTVVVIVLWRFSTRQPPALSGAVMITDYRAVANGRQPIVLAPGADAYTSVSNYLRDDGIINGRWSLDSYAPHLVVEHDLLRLDFHSSVVVVSFRDNVGSVWKQRVREYTLADRQMKAVLEQEVQRSMQE